MKKIALLLSLLLTLAGSTRAEHFQVVDATTYFSWQDHTGVTAQTKGWTADMTEQGITLRRDTTTVVDFMFTGAPLVANGTTYQDAQETRTQAIYTLFYARNENGVVFGWNYDDGVQLFFKFKKPE